MVSYNLTSAAKNVYDSGLSLFSLKTLNDVLQIKKQSTSYSTIKRLVKSQILQKIEKNKYLLVNSAVHDFALANFLYEPSYISFASALNLYGILSQFPYEISSATSKKTKEKIFNGRSFTYTHLKKELIWGYEKKDSFLIAVPEKALLDQLYLSAKGYKNIDLDEYDFSIIRPKELKTYLKKYPQTAQFIAAKRKLQKYIKL